jgi:hypothetical protein
LADLLALHPNRPVRQTVKGKAARPGPKAWDASVDLGVVRLAVEHLAQFQATVLDCHL